MAGAEAGAPQLVLRLDGAGIAHIFLQRDDRASALGARPAAELDRTAIETLVLTLLEAHFLR